MEYINYNGQFFPSTQPILKATNRSFKYGDGLFESIRLMDGKIPFIKDHIVRLQNGMHLMKMDIPTNYSTTYFQTQILELAIKNDIGKNGRARITVFRKEGGLYTPATNEVEYLLELNPLASATYTLNEKGMAIDVFYDVAKTTDKTTILKSCNSLPYVLAALYKQEKGLDESIILNTHGRIADTVSSNLFIVHGNKIITPLLSESSVRGIMRNHVLKIAQSAGLQAEEGRLIPEDLLQADEVFLTNAIRGILWVSSFRGKQYTNEVAKLLVDKINESII